MSTLAIKGGSKAIPDGAIKPWPWVTREDKKAVADAVAECSPWMQPLPQIKKLEEEWAAFVGTKHCLAANSGTSALHMAVAAAGIGPGDEVLCPAFTFLASASCVLHSNGIPIFVDVDPRTFNIDPAGIEAAITEKTKAIIAVDIHGLPADFDAIRAIARKHNLVLIEDYAQSHGATYKGRMAGSLGDIGGCSLNASKNFASACEGGLLTTNDARYYELAKRVRMFGEIIEPGKPRQYNAYIMGWNYRFDNLQAAFVRSQLKRFPEMTRIRVRHAEYLTRRLDKIPGLVTPYVPPDCTHVYFFYVLRVKPQQAGLEVKAKTFRDVAMRALHAEGLPVQSWQTVPVPGQALFQYMDGYGKGCPWNCPHARKGIKYRVEDYPEALKVVQEFLAIGHVMGGLGPPNTLATMRLYADAFEKVMVDNLKELADMCLAEEKQAAAR